jgi:hypothetical protein
LENLPGVGEVLQLCREKHTTKNFQSLPLVFLTFLQRITVFLARKVDGSRQRPAIVKGKRLVLSKFVIGFSPLLIRPVKFAGSWQRPAPVPGKN